MSLDATAILDAIVSHAMALGLFERVNSHEPMNPPGHGLTCAVWADSISPLPAGSGLHVTSGRVVFNVRIYTSADSEPRDAIDPHMMAATNLLINAYSTDFELGGNVRNVDLLGQGGVPLSAQAGYLEQDRKLFRVMTLVVPVLVNDVWEQVP